MGKYATGGTIHMSDEFALTIMMVRDYEKMVDRRRRTLVTRVSRAAVTKRQPWTDYIGVGKLLSVRRPPKR